jgi:hypothetical protein
MLMIMILITDYEPGLETMGPLLSSLREEGRRGFFVVGPEEGRGSGKRKEGERVVIRLMGPWPELES